MGKYLLTSTTKRQDSLLRDAMHPRYYSHGPVSVCLSVCVCHNSEFY